jgi:hypothetical protein
VSERFRATATREFARVLTSLHRIRRAAQAPAEAPPPEDVVRVVSLLRQRIDQLERECAPQDPELIFE